LARLNRDLDNLRIALEWSLSGFVVKGLRIATALLWFWSTRTHWEEGIEWLNRMLAAEELQSATCPRQEADWIARGKALNTLSYLALREGFTDRTQFRARVLESKAIFQKLINELGDAFQRDFAISIFLLAETEQDFVVCRQLFQIVQDPLFLAECDQDLTVLCMQKSNLYVADVYNEENLELRKKVGDLDGKAYALYLAALIALCRGEHSMAIELAEKSLNTFEAVGNRAIIGFPLAILRIVEMVQGDYQQVIEQSEMERALGQDLSSPYLLKDALSYEGYVAWACKEYEQAVRLAQKALEIANDLPSVWKKMPLYLLGRMALSRGDYPQAREYLVELLTSTLHWDIFEYDYHAIQALGVMAAAQGQEQRAAIMFGAQEALCSWLLNIICPPERDEYEQALVITRSALGEKAFVAAWEEGRSMTEEQLRQYVAELPMENPVVKYMQKKIDSQ
jgi:tetratricopeptide (TPR) repeat protein